MINKRRILIAVLLSTIRIHGKIALFTGIGPGAYSTENKLGNFKLTQPTTQTTCHTTSLFKTQPAPFFAFMCGGTLEAHKNAFVSGLITGGLLPYGRACFTTKEYCSSSPAVSINPAQFNGHFFISAYGSGGLNFPITDTFAIQPSLGYGLNSEYLNVCTLTTPTLFGRFTRQFVGPFATLAGTYQRSALTASLGYQCMMGTIQNSLTYPHLHTQLLVTIPGIMNSVNAIITYAVTNAIALSLNISYGNLSNYKRGRVTTLINNIVQNNNAYAAHYFIKSFATYIQATLLY